MGLILSSTPRINESLKIRQDELAGMFLNSEVLKNAGNNDYTILSEEDLRNLFILMDGNPYVILQHFKNPDQKPLLQTPIGIHIIKLGFYTMLMTNSSNDNLTELMNDKFIRQSWVTTQGFVIPTELVTGFSQRNFVVNKSVADKDTLELQEDPYDILNESVVMIDRKLRELVKDASKKQRGAAVVPKNKNLLQLWNYAFLDLNTASNISTLRFKFKENMTIAEYFPFLQTFLQFINKYDTDSYNRVVKDILELKYSDTQYLNLPESRIKRARDKRKNDVEQTLNLTELQDILEGTIDLIQNSTKTGGAGHLYERVLASVPPISITQARGYRLFAPLEREFDRLKRDIDTQIAMIQQDMKKNYVNCADEPENNRRLVFNDPSTINLCKKYNELAIGNNGVDKIHKDTAIVFADILSKILKTQKKILTSSYEFLLKYRTDAGSYNPAASEIMRQEEAGRDETI
jgi:hypothetical protein